VNGCSQDTLQLNLKFKNPKEILDFDFFGLGFWIFHPNSIQTPSFWARTSDHMYIYKQNLTENRLFKKIDSKTRFLKSIFKNN
jgi:hypothetical protein